jgi:hypothetical protein
MTENDIIARLERLEDEIDKIIVRLDSLCLRLDGDDDDDDFDAGQARLERELDSIAQRSRERRASYGRK